MDGVTPIVPLNVGGQLWDQVFVPAPLVLVGTLEADGSPDLAPKHQAMPLGWDRYFGFVCTARHRTYTNAQRTGQFTVSYPSPSEVVAIGQAAAPRVGEEKPALAVVDQIPAFEVDGVLAANASLWLECNVHRIIDGFGEHDLIVGQIVHAAAPDWAIRGPDRDDADLIREHPALAFIAPSRFATIADTMSFPFPAEFSR